MSAIRYADALISLFLLLFLLAPPIQLGNIPFQFQIGDFLVPFMGIAILLKNQWWKESYKPLIIIAIISLYILFTIIINPESRTINNFYEIYDILKLGIYYIFLKIYLNMEKYYKLIDILFILILIFNFLHYFNILNFNETIMPLYCGEHNNNLLFFGYYSNGMPGPKRMIGTMANPNYNALVFLFFLVNYAPRKEWNKKDMIFYYIAVLCLICCQSRTSLIALVAITVANYCFSEIHWKKIIVQCLVIVVIFLCTMPFNMGRSDAEMQKNLISTGYIMTIEDEGLLESNSWQLRIEMWQRMLNSIWEQPVFGHSPDKAFFYGNHAYADNEYMLILYCYGFVGLLLYLMMYGLPCLKALPIARQNIEAKKTLLMLGGFMVAAMTNEPFSNHRICYIIVITLVLFYKSVSVNNMPKKQI